MKIVSMLQLAVLLLLAMHSQASTIVYEHPDLTIVAKAEPLDSVLKSLGKEMRIFITIPSGFNPTVSCDIQHQPIAQALKTLLKDVSYSLEWEKGGERLAGVTILGSGSESAVAADSRSHASSQSAAVPAVIAGGAEAGASAAPVYSSVPGAEHETAMLPDKDAAMAEHEARMEAERAEMQTRMAEERAAQEEKMKEEVARHEAQNQADLDAYLASKGLTMPR
jgi:hypothetical protein